ncbi:hypothetical protein BDF20DRAFT_1002557 [Mycotypha africana]|uniref:uncharacterized protein n=1 Tax=Mycotypha africana TaxID=64632 RepID=UPI0022FFEBDF|nr:uncharacterized protein BDF20DRAFT_1002557 [Mycotypha africana]KAI8973629.1 hypothetical protein BDF20DRAFT_1002557 [Mycotypha africana]
MLPEAFVLNSTIFLLKTIRRVLKSSEIDSKIKKSALPLTNEHRRNHLRRAKAHIKWTVDDWKKIVFKSKEEVDKKHEESESNKDEKKDILFHNDAQIVDFINYIYRPKAEHSPDSPLYKLQFVDDKEILGIVWTFTTKFDRYTLLAFTQWLNKQNVDLLTDEPERKIVKRSSEKVRLRMRALSVLDSRYYGKARKMVLHDNNYFNYRFMVDVAKYIIDVILRHHAYIDQLKKDGYHIVGYGRKSKNTY